MVIVPRRLLPCLARREVDVDRDVVVMVRRSEARDTDAHQVEALGVFVAGSDAPADMYAGRHPGRGRGWRLVSLGTLAGVWMMPKREFVVV